ncbi:MAG: ABC transporter permease subunit [Spirochaetia bacterium]|nr:ABC transporter permease subunit [Spirochaetia bacterium]
MIGSSTFLKNRNSFSGKRSFFKGELYKLTPLLIPGLMLAAGILYTLQLSLQPADLSAYQAALAQPGLVRNIFFSLYVAAISTVVSIAAGTALAYLVWRLPSAYGRWGQAFLVPLVLPHIAVGFLVLLWFSQTGILASMFERLSGVFPLASSFQSPLFKGNGAGIILGYVYKSTPFALLLIMPVLRRIPKNYLQTGLMLGASEFRCFYKIILPRLVPGISAAAIIIFVYSFGAYDLPFIVGESRPRMISLYLYRLYFTRPIAERPTAAALLLLVFLCGIAMVMLYARAVRPAEERERKL